MVCADSVRQNANRVKVFDKSANVWIISWICLKCQKQDLISFKSIFTTLKQNVDTYGRGRRRKRWDVGSAAALCVCFVFVCALCIWLRYEIEVRLSCYSEWYIIIENTIGQRMTFVASTTILTLMHLLQPAPQPTYTLIITHTFFQNVLQLFLAGKWGILWHHASFTSK